MQFDCEVKVIVGCWLRRRLEHMPALGHGGCKLCKTMRVGLWHWEGLPGPWVL